MDSSSSSSTTTTITTTIKSIQFSLDKNIYIEPPSCMNDADDCSSTWYTIEEFQAMRDEIDRDIHKFNNATTIKGGRRSISMHHHHDGDEGVEIRGLECRTNLGRRNASDIRSRARIEVLQEQKRQRQTTDGCCHDEELISQLYRGYSVASSLQAQQMAKIDAAHNVEFVSSLVAATSGIDDSLRMTTTVGSNSSLPKTKTNMMMMAKPLQLQRPRRNHHHLGLRNTVAALRRMGI